MGVADNKSYKHEYHFTDVRKSTSENNPSIEVDPKVNTSIKENPYRSNVEIEGGEIVLQPDLSALFKAHGKRHSKGGMDVLLKPDSFVFSDFKDLTITEKEHELFELKEGGTPAKTLKKNVDIKHYNTLVNILEDPKKDELAKKSASRMMEKYISTVGNIAYIQEQKKGFPQGIPDFAMDTAPVYNPELKADIEANKQYMKAGGTTNPYLPKSQVGGKWGYYDKNIIRQQNRIYDKDRNTLFKNYEDIEKDKFGTYLGLQNLTISPLGLPTLVRPKSVIRGPETDSWRNAIQAKIDKGYTPEQLIAAGDINKDGVSKFNWPNISNNDIDNKFAFLPIAEKPRIKIPQDVLDQFNDPQPTTQTNTQSTLTPNSDNGDASGVKRADWKFTPWQKLSQAYNAAQYAGVKRYMPYRSRYDATYVDPALVNPEQAVGDMKGMANQQLAAANILNPFLRNAQAASTFGQTLQQIPGVRSQYDNQNAQILNQTRQYNNQLKNNESMVNMGNDQNYYQQAVEGRKNFDNMRQFTANQYMNNVLRDVETNQKLSYNLLTQNNPAYAYDWKTGNFTRNEKDIRDAQSGQGAGMYDKILAGLEKLSDSDPQKWKIYAEIMKQKNFLPYFQQQSNPLQKKGGKVGRNPYK